MKHAFSVFRLAAKVPILLALLGLVLGSLLSTVGGIAIAAYWNGRASTENLKHQHYRLISQAMSLKVRRLLDPAQRILTEYQMLATRGLLPLDNADELGLRLAEALRARASLGWLSYSDARTGRFVGAWSHENGSIVLNESAPDIDGGRPHERVVDPDGETRPLNRNLPPGYDPRSKEWFKRATQSNQLVWSEPYVFNEGQPGITASRLFKCASGCTRAT